MSNASTPEGRGPERPQDAEPFFPSEGTFNPVVPLSEIGDAPAPLTLPTVNPADVGKPAEAAWAREAHRARLKEDEETLVPSRAARAPRGRPSWLVPAFVVAVSVVAGLASGTYLIWSAQRTREAPTPAQVAAETPALPPASEATPAPVAEQAEASTKVEKAKEPSEDEKPKDSQAEKPAEVAKAEKPVAPAPKQAPPPQPAPRAERTTRAAEAKEVTPAPKPARTQNAAQPRPRLTTAARQPTAPPISTPPPTAKSKKVIQWP